MRLLNFLEYSVSPWMRFMACGVLGSALFLLYRWDPERVAQDNEDNESCTELPLQPPVSESALATFYGNRGKESETSDKSRSTLIELERYLDALSEHRVRSLDQV